MPDRPGDDLFVAFDPFRPRHSRYARRRSDDLEQARPHESVPGYTSPISTVDYSFRLPDNPRLPGVVPRWASSHGYESSGANDYSRTESPVRSHDGVSAGSLASPVIISRIGIPESAPYNGPHVPAAHPPQERPSSATTYESPSSSYLPSRPTYWYSEGLHEAGDGA